MLNSKNFLIATIIIAIMSYVFDWFDKTENISNLALVLAWCAFYEVIKGTELNNKNLDKIESRFENIEKKL